MLLPVICPHCQQRVEVHELEVGHDAPCPQCQKEFFVPATARILPPIYQKQNKKEPTGIIILVIIVIVGCALAFIFGKSEPEKIPDSVSASVEASSQYVVLVNKNTRAWHGGRATINDTYEARFKIVEPGKYVDIKTMEFTKDDGTRFNPFATKIMKLEIRVDGFSSSIYSL